MTEALTRLTQLTRVYGDHPPLGDGAAIIAWDETGVDRREQVRVTFDGWAKGLQGRADEPLSVRLARLNLRLFQELGLRGDEDGYDDPVNSRIDEVIQRRRGLPILLSIVTIEVAARVGLHLDPIGFPGHFLVSPREGEPRFYVDPFHAGAILRQDDLRARLNIGMAGRGVSPEVMEQLLGPLSPRLTLTRMNHNLKGSWSRRGDTARALAAVDRILALAPEQVDEHRDRGVLLVQLERPEEALDAFESYLRLVPGASDAPTVRGWMRSLRR